MHLGMRGGYWLASLAVLAIVPSRLVLSEEPKPVLADEVVFFEEPSRSKAYEKLEAGEMHSRFDGLPFGGTLYSGSVFLAADTFAGPAYFGFGLGEAGNYSVYLLLGAP